MKLQSPLLAKLISYVNIVGHGIPAYYSPSPQSCIRPARLEMLCTPQFCDTLIKALLLGAFAKLISAPPTRRHALTNGNAVHCGSHFKSPLIV
jgi:hypothetical protein